MEAVTDAKIAESSPVPHSQKTLDSMTPEQRTEWKSTGKLPVAPPKEESATSEETEVTAEAGKQPENASKSALETNTEPLKKKASNAETRKAELEAEINGLLAKRHALRTEVEQKPAPKEETKKAAESSTADAYKPLDEEQFFKENPTADYNAYIRAEARNAAQFELKAERTANEKTAREAEIAKANKALEESWGKKVAESAKKHPDFKDVATRSAQAIPVGSPVDAFILDSEIGTELLYHLGANEAELGKIMALPSPLAQLRALVRLEDTLSKPVPKKTISDAPTPPSEVGGTTTAADDPVEEAIKTGDMAAYKAAMNARDLKGQKA